MKIIAKYKYLFILLLCVIIGVIIYVSLKGDDKMDTTNKNQDNVKKESAFIVTSPSFNNGGVIPAKYTGHGEDISIPLEFKNIASAGKSIAIIMDDPDAPTTLPFIHWLIWNIPVTITKIPEGIPTDNEVMSLDGAIQGKNGFGKIGYMGPNPPSGTHAYKIKIYVLDSFLDLKAGSSKASLENAMQNHILQSALLEGTFSR